ncbi:hypothetical protein NCCP1664_20690 [Zafaria cholistanensis]|uniref:Uncharacterized protein n=1 Tax=Zafaria cholistanensis TaxID=1682741 RepID=A0A5A7NRP1_9MICC|nr:hypothetical protein [Zafaria cholistanensis]GER23574.1 hypothetical protein NCCP1664_20690 [Zafaria cholistanensis]
MKTTALLTPLAVLAAAAGLVASSAPAHAAADEVQFINAQLLANGAAISAEVGFACQKGWQSTISIAVSQANGREAAIGRYYPGHLNECTGQPQTLEAVILPETLVFREGSAAIWVTLDLCPAAQPMGPVPAPEGTAPDGIAPPATCRSGDTLVLETNLAQ